MWVSRGEYVTLFPKKYLGKVSYFSEVREKFPIFESAHHLSRIAIYAFSLVTTLKSGNRMHGIEMILNFLGTPCFPRNVDSSFPFGNI